MSARKLVVVFAGLSLMLMLSLSTGCGSVGETPSTNTARSNTNSPTPAAATTPATSTAATAKLNVNTASGEQLTAAIPGLGNRMLHEFEEYRPYKSIQQFRKEIGKYVDQAKVAEYEKYIFVPIDHNQSDAA